MEQCKIQSAVSSSICDDESSFEGLYRRSSVVGGALCYCGVVWCAVIRCTAYSTAAVCGVV